MESRGDKGPATDQTRALARELSDSGAALTRLAAEHYLAGCARKNRDAHWRLSERWFYGRRLGWYVEHDGYRYDRIENGEDGPFATYEEAAQRMAEHLPAAIADASGHCRG